MKLYETVEGLALVSAWLDEHADAIAAAGGELPAELAELMEKANVDFNTKVTNVALKVRELEAEAAGIETEAKRLAARQKAAEGAAEGLKRYLFLQMQAAKVLKVEDPRITVAMQNGAAKVWECPAVDQLPAKYVRQPEPLPPEVDKKALLDAFKAGEKLPEGVRIAPTVSLRLR